MTDRVVRRVDRPVSPRPSTRRTGTGGTGPEVVALLEEYAAVTAISPRGDLTARILAAVAAEPDPTPGRLYLGALLGFEPALALAAFRETLRAAFGSRRVPTLVRAQALALVLLTALAASALGAAGAIGVTTVVQQRVPQPQVQQPALPPDSPDQTEGPGETDELQTDDPDTESRADPSPEVDATDGVRETDEPGATDGTEGKPRPDATPGHHDGGGDATAKPTEGHDGSTPKPTARPTERPHEDPTDKPDDTRTPHPTEADQTDGPQHTDEPDETDAPETQSPDDGDGDGSATGGDQPRPSPDDGDPDHGSLPLFLGWWPVW